MKKPRDISLTREVVYGWLQEFEGTRKKTKKMRDFVEKKLRDNGHDPDEVVDTSTNDSLKDGTSLLDIIMEDIESYG